MASGRPPSLAEVLEIASCKTDAQYAVVLGKLKIILHAFTTNPSMSEQEASELTENLFTLKKRLSNNPTLYHETHRDFAKIAISFFRLMSTVECELLIYTWMEKLFPCYWHVYLDHANRLNQLGRYAESYAIALEVVLSNKYKSKGLPLFSLPNGSQMKAGMQILKDCFRQADDEDKRIISAYVQRKIDREYSADEEPKSEVKVKNKNLLAQAIVIQDPTVEIGNQRFTYPLDQGIAWFAREKQERDDREKQERADRELDEFKQLLFSQD